MLSHQTSMMLAAIVDGGEEGCEYSLSLNFHFGKRYIRPSSQDIVPPRGNVF
jgi:hypothetical protein